MKKSIRRKLLLDILGELKIKEIRGLYFYMIFYCIRRKTDGWMHFPINFNLLLERLSFYKIEDLSYLMGDYFEVEPFFGNVLDGINLKRLDKTKLSVTYTVNQDGLDFNIYYKGEK